ncbi:response regulator transcription factor [Amycolatopsis sp. cmx-4-61]|uniref:response regulator transcription factor n=1 Tax=Amycolatopsis sp. cmx-4-61 TaxID=2790937 RepID=UPI00397D3C5A
MVEPNPVVRFGLCGMLKTCIGSEVSAHVPAVDELTEGEKASCTIAVLGPGVQLAEVQQFAETCLVSHLRLIVLINAPQPEAVLRATSIGVAAVLSHNSGVVDMQAAVEAARGSGFYANSDCSAAISSMASRITTAIDCYDQGVLRNLPAQEVAVLSLLGRGRSNAQIAKEMHISESSAKAHVSHLLSKLGAANRAEAAVLASICAVAEVDMGEGSGVPEPALSGIVPARNLAQDDGSRRTAQHSRSAALPPENSARRDVPRSRVSTE